MDKKPKKKYQYFGKSCNDESLPDYSNKFPNETSPDSGINSRLNTAYDDSPMECNTYSTTSYSSDKTLQASPTESCYSPCGNVHTPNGLPNLSSPVYEQLSPYLLRPNTHPSMDLGPTDVRWPAISSNHESLPDYSNKFLNVSSPDSGISSRLSTAYDDSPLESSTTSSSPYSSDETLTSSPTEGCYSPYGNVYTPNGLPDLSPYGYEPQSPYLPRPNTQASMGLGPSEVGWPAVSAVQQLSITSKCKKSSTVSSSNEGMCSPPIREVGAANAKGKATRPQKCRMCENHNLSVDVKGHKWYCEFKDCKCYKCHVTRELRNHMKDRQQLTRKQQLRLEEQQQPLDNCRSSKEMYVQRPPSSTGDAMDYPRKEDLKRETQNILDEDCQELFKQINQKCRSKANLRLGAIPSVSSMNF